MAKEEKEEVANETAPLLEGDRQVHRLESHHEGGSAVEQLAAKIEQRERDRIPITLLVRLNLIFDFRDKDPDQDRKIKRQDLVSLREEYAREVNLQRKNPWTPWKPSFFGIKTPSLYKLHALDRAILHFDNIDDDWFHYAEWLFYHTAIESKWPWMRNETNNAIVAIILFFLATPVFFCYVLGDENICGPTGMNWLNGFYIASVTMSTVGYGDITISKENINVATLYMIVSICVAILAFSAAASQTALTFERLFKFNPREVAKDEVLAIRMLYIGLLKIGEIALMFVILNFLGVIASRFFHGNLSQIDEGSEWTWSESIYWSVQLTTTIGYGDMVMSDEMRVFQVFYLCLGTFLVGNTLGKLANLKHDLENMRALYAWEQREVSKEMLRYDQADSKDPRVDQYEFVVASLLNLGKISSNDIKPIMNQFRKLAKSSGDQGFINLGDSSQSYNYQAA